MLSRCKLAQGCLFEASSRRVQGLVQHPSAMFPSCCKGPGDFDDMEFKISVAAETAGTGSVAETSASDASDVAEPGNLTSGGVETGANAAPDPKNRLILVSDNLPDYEVLIQAAKDNVLVVPVRYSSWALQDLVEQLVSCAGLPARQFKSVALLDHGKPGDFCLLESVAGGSVELEEIQNSQELQSFLKHIAGYVQEAKVPHLWKHDQDSRVDLLGCCIAEGKVGSELMEYLEELTQVNWCASTNKTGAGDGAEAGFDWTMESDPNVGCVAEDYFEKSKLFEWKHTAAHLGATEWYNLGIAGGGQVAGKVYSKIECYEQALKCKPDHASYSATSKPWSASQTMRMHGSTLELQAAAKYVARSTRKYSATSGGGRVASLGVQARP
eukprot:TRINITY_DN3970_c0_g1_i5.p1 TRINITY_DN3970_c0_g1~~TRINITY_DN3970_c0_g1_i5.p1  ORF type:complete len:384 (-),score=91.19 TRINITY_DN3970_c0_g1_i5:135-1286(-)